MEEKSPPINALIPLWDMANHAEGLVSTDYDDVNHTIKCMANANFKNDQEFTICYGARPNHDLLVHNGFTYDNNRHSTLVIKLGVSNNDSLAAAKIELLTKIGLAQQGHFSLNLNLLQEKEDDMPFDRMLLAFLRVLCMNSADEISAWNDEEKAKELLNDTTHAELDKKSHQYLLTRCTLLLRSYPTSLEEDCELLEKAEPNASPFKKDCITLRFGEKKILHGVIDFCKQKS